MKIARRCPRCRQSYYHFVSCLNGKHIDAMNTAPQDMPYRVEIMCSGCGHQWIGRLRRIERGYEE